MAGGTRRITIGFQGGGALALRASDEQLQALNQALDGGGWYEIDSEDGPVRVYLAQVVYVSADKDDSRVGFG
ncbi:MAG TPA: hypothetical protein VGY13_06505 [Solirubrobacteraceae bacterium]|jgi:hypothetical protein|nr:hypothetical protein [Solirubrobacteraceae bacterium]